MEPVSEEKSRLRKKLIKKRNEMSRDSWTEKSRSIEKHLFNLEKYQRSKVLHLFISMNKRFEPDTSGILTRALSDGKKVVVPVTNFEDSTLTHTMLTDTSTLKENKWGVLEPGVIEPVSADLPDLILVPLLAADRTGNRLGYGKGFYDGFLSKAKGYSLGVVFDEFIIDKVPVEAFDIKLNGLISETGLIQV